MGGAQNFAAVVSSSVRVDARVASEALDLVDGLRPVRAGERGRSRRPELAGGVEDEGRDASPRGEHWRRVVGRGGLVGTGVGRRRDEGWWRRGRTVVGPGGQHESGREVPDPDPFPRGLVLGERSDVVGQHLVEHRLHRRVQRHQRVVRRFVGGGVGTGRPGRVHGEEVGPVGVGDRRHRVIDGGVHDGVAAGGVHIRGLRAGRLQDRQQRLVPVHDGLARAGPERRIRPRRARRRRRHPDNDHCGDSNTCQRGHHLELLPHCVLLACDSSDRGARGSRASAP